MKTLEQMNLMQFRILRERGAYTIMTFLAKYTCCQKHTTNARKVNKNGYIEKSKEKEVTE